LLIDVEAAQLSGNIASAGAAARLLASEMVIITGSGSAHTRSTSVVGFKCFQDLQRVLQIHQSLGARAGSLAYHPAAPQPTEGGSAITYQQSTSGFFDYSITSSS
jgi:hypothetical protein